MMFAFLIARLFPLQFYWSGMFGEWQKQSDNVFQYLTQVKEKAWGGSYLTFSVCILLLYENISLLLQLKLSSCWYWKDCGATLIYFITFFFSKRLLWRICPCSFLFSWLLHGQGKSICKNLKQVSDAPGTNFMNSFGLCSKAMTTNERCLWGFSAFSSRSNA